MNIENNRIETHKIDRIIKFMLFCGISLIIISIIKIFTSEFIQTKGFVWWFDVLWPLIFCLAMLTNYKNLKNRRGQFIEWTKDDLIFKLKNEVEPKKIRQNQIESIIIQADIIEIIEKSKQTNILDISDFNKYEDRLKIKSNFENQKQLIPK